MAPPRTAEPADGGPVDAEAEYLAIVAELAEVQGVINVAEARVVALTARALEVGVSGGTDLSPEKWLAWRNGIAPGRAAGIVRLARRSGELPATIAALGAGDLTVDQAAEIAQWVPPRYEASAARVAQSCTVSVLKKTLPSYRDPKEPKPGDTGAGDDREDAGSVTTGFDERGYYAHIRLPEAAGTIVDQALKAMQDDLRRQARADAPKGCEPQRITTADALVALAETALLAGEAARPGTDRYLVHVHLQAGPHGLELMTHLGIALPEPQRRHLLCDAKLRGLVHDPDTAAPLSTGRVTRHINRRLRRAIEHRDGGCTVPGCGRTTGLEIHHIWHWEDGGPTDTSNLLTLCAFHHRCHHQGTLGIEGDADLPRHRAPGVVFTNRWGHPLDATGTPIRPVPRSADTTEGTTAAAQRIGLAPHRYRSPSGERVDLSGFHLQADHPDPNDLGPHARIRPDDAAAEPDADLPPEVTGQRPSSAAPPASSPTSGRPIDPTRAGPQH
jgi:hypothetical protein